MRWGSCLPFARSAGLSIAMIDVGVCSNKRIVGAILFGFCWRWCLVKWLGLVILAFFSGEGVSMTPVRGGLAHGRMTVPKSRDFVMVGSVMLLSMGYSPAVLGGVIAAFFMPWFWVHADFRNSSLICLAGFA